MLEYRSAPTQTSDGRAGAAIRDRRCYRLMQSKFGVDIVCEIERFDSPLDIAFSLSAVFYYLELRSIARERTQAALVGHELALRTEIGRFISAVVDAVINMASSLIYSGNFYDNFLSNFGRLAWLGLKIGILFVLRGILKLSSVLVHVFALLSSVVSLGTLIYSGYYKNEIDCRLMTVILCLSFTSIFWNILVYFIYIPLATRLLRHRERPPTAIVNETPLQGPHG
jgi:hypothetical protein